MWHRNTDVDAFCKGDAVRHLAMDLSNLDQAVRLSPSEETLDCNIDIGG